MIKQKSLLLIFFALLLLSCQKEDFSISGIINDHFFLKSGGQNMPVTVAGNIDSDKLLLIVHGGPGGNALAYRNDYVKTNVESEFAVVYWYQRFAGNTQGNNGDIHISAFRNDLEKLIHLLKHAYGEDKKIYLFAHSWGGFLAPYFLVEPGNESLVDGWIQVGGAHDYALNDRLTHEMLLNIGNEQIQSNSNAEEWVPIVEWCKSNSHEGNPNAAMLNRFAATAETLIDEIERPSIFESDLSIMLSNYISISSGLTNSLASNWFNIAEAAYGVKLSESFHQLTIPTLLLWGKYDFVCPSGLMDDIIEHLEMTQPEYHIFEKSGHAPMYNEPYLFWETVINFLNKH
jgi:pimeloyl-ACP methyl ester carboxylesterase